MRREILFRGKRADNGEWVEGYLADEDYINVPFNDDDVNGRLDEPIEVYSETVCEYTGSTDKNGRKIFEGDICQNNNNVVHVLWSNKYQWGVEIRKTDNALCRGRTIPLWLYDNREGRTLEVIGNIFDNIGLLGSRLKE